MISGQLPDKASLLVSVAAWPVQRLGASSSQFLWEGRDPSVTWLRAAPKASVKVSAMAAVFSGSAREESTFKPTRIVLAGGRALLAVGQGCLSSRLHRRAMERGKSQALHDLTRQKQHPLTRPSPHEKGGCASGRRAALGAIQELPAPRVLVQ